MNLLTYKGYMARITFDTDDMVIVGEVLGVRDILSFHAETCDQVEGMFHQSVDGYLDMCREIGKVPDRPTVDATDRMKGRCRFPDGISIRPDGVHPLDPCVYEEMEIHTNATVFVMQCKVCGHVDIGWRRQEDTEDIILAPLAPEPVSDY